MEKNRFVLEHKIGDLRRQIEPKEEWIAELRAQIEQMEDELNAVSRTQKDLELQVKDAKGRMVVAVSDLSTEKKKHVKQQGLHNRLQRDLADVQNQLQAWLPDGDSQILRS